MTLKSRGPIPLYYELLYGIRTLNPFRVHFVLKDILYIELRVIETQERGTAEHEIWYLAK